MDTERLNSSAIDATFQNWIAELESRHLAELTFPEVSRALRALSSAYVERRHKIAEGSALSVAGKRSAFALFYGPLHFLLVEHIARSIIEARRRDLVVDLGCGTGAAGAALAVAQRDAAEAGDAAATGQPVAQGFGLAVLGIDRNSWALVEASRTYRAFGLQGRTRQGDASATAFPKPPATFVAAFTVNELQGPARDALLTRLFERARAARDRVLIVEPLARGVAPWWNQWAGEAKAAGGRADEWRFAVELPPIVEKLDRAAGLNHRELTGRSLWIG